MHALQPRDPAGRVHFCKWFLPSVVEGDIEPQFTFFTDKAWFHLQGYINVQNNCYSKPLKVGVWCAVSARRIVVPVFFNETINFERRLRVQGQHF
jgi:hypothetical protein